MALGRERAKNAALLAELAAARREGGAAARLDAASAAAREARDGGAALEREAKEAKAHVAAMGAKLAAQKTANEALKAEVARYARALAREVGEEVGSARVRELLDEGSGAKGRAQQIALLKEQLRELARRAGDGVAPAADERQRSNLSGIEAERRRELERLLLRENQLVGEVAEAKKKVDAQAARIKILEGDVKSKKEKLLVLLRKSDADDQLVGALRAELEKTRAGGEEGKGEQLAQRVAQQQAQITRQEQIILSLRDQLQRLQDREEARPGSSPRQPHDLIVSQAENAKLRELVALLQDKLRDYEQQRR
ncbi:hypothetical protein AB1Y20_022978 [Prymnesium parvum]|uniref:Centrosomal protein of 162 kDa n=1 Tax=Prymnesium parvum TaxID=97485 RepID=A0AB34JFB7_PRYPA